MGAALAVSVTAVQRPEGGFPAVYSSTATCRFQFQVVGLQLRLKPRCVQEILCCVYIERDTELQLLLYNPPKYRATNRPQP